MAWQRGIDGGESFGSEPVGGLSGIHEERRAERSSVLAAGSMACPACDAPVVPPGPVSPAHPIACPWCEHAGRVRDFLSLALPTRPARVEVRVVMRGRLATRITPRRAR